MKILVLNSGSSSLKYQLIDMPNEKLICKGLVDKISLDDSKIVHNIGDEKIVLEEKISNHKQALDKILKLISSGENAVIKKLGDIKAVGHRVVHGGEKFSKSTMIDDEVLSEITKCEVLAPLHNPANKLGILAIKEILGDIPQVAVFDTAFHQTMKEENYLYAIPYDYYKKYKIRRYGFHGTSHNYVSQKACEFLQEDIKNKKIITCHIGNGASIAAIENGKVVETSMGFTPLEGLIMGTRSGDLDPSIVSFLMEQENLTTQDINTILNKKSGLLGITEKTSDLRDIIQDFENGNKQAILAINMYINRIVKYIGAYVALMGGVDTIVFTAGVLENSPFIRKKIVDKLSYFGIKLDEQNNNSSQKEKLISTKDSNIKVVVIPTNEELMIAKDTYEII